MKRIDKIHSYIKARSSQYHRGQLKGRVGFTAAEIAEQLNILRNNVSMELNVLVKQGKIIKLKGRPVLYFDKQVLEELCGITLNSAENEFENMEEVIKLDADAEARSPFQHLIGAYGSLKKQVEQAKAAVFYPPNGLHTLILGQTGVGKTLFANLMYEYGKHVKKFSEEASFVIFNCADFYHNPQLLVSQLFGHIKGAFTGADADKKGLVERADGGILFLDEIHRLPPEGQEMIFYFMDTGTFNRLGETTRSRKANVLIIGATTEEYTSVLIKTFIRRIPNIITLPPLQERSLKERLDIVKFLLAKEAHRVDKPVEITAEAVKALLGSISYGGNIGQLKSTIQLSCAKAFLHGMHNKQAIEIDFKILPEQVKNGLLFFGNQDHEAEEILQYLHEKTLTISQKHTELFAEDSDYEPPFNLYKIIEDKVSLLKSEGINDETIKKFLYTDINSHIKSFYHKFNRYGSAKEKLLTIIDQNILEFAQEVQQLAKEQLYKEYNERFIYAFSLHLSSLLKRVNSNEKLQKYSDMDMVIAEYPAEYNVALSIKAKLEQRFSIIVPEVELEYFTLLLSSVQEEEQYGQVAVIVVAHGNSTASSMVEAVQKLIGFSQNLYAVDMPLEMSPKHVLDKLSYKIQEMRECKGVLLLVDMGVLSNFGTILDENLACKIRTLDMVSTSLVLEAARKASLPHMDVDTLYYSLKKFRGYDSLQQDRQEVPKAIVTICTSGEGAAIKLKQLVEELLIEAAEETIEVIPASVLRLAEHIKEIQAKHTVLATVGVADPGIDAPFIPLEALFDGRGEKMLWQIIHHGEEVIEPERDIVVKNLAEDSLAQFLTYLNPSKIVSVLLSFQSVLEEKLHKQFSNTQKLKLIVHCGCALERMVIHEGLVYRENKDELSQETIQCIKTAAEVFTDTLQLSLTDDEIYYIAEMLK